VKKLLPWIVLAIVVIWIMHNPAQAGADVQSWINGASSFGAHL
jgi:hypothetical protein